MNTFDTKPNTKPHTSQPANQPASQSASQPRTQSAQPTACQSCASVSSTSDSYTSASSACASNQGIKQGVFISFEGCDKAGKSTHIKHLSAALEQHGYKVVYVQEPGSTQLGAHIREIVKTCSEPLSAKAELMLFLAARAQLVDTVIRPALTQGCVVLADRFMDSSVAYQGYGRGLDPAFIERCNAFVCDECVPDKTILLIPEGNPHEKFANELVNNEHDRMEREGVEFQQATLAGYHYIAQQYPQRIAIVHTASSKECTFKRVCEALSGLFPCLHHEELC